MATLSMKQFKPYVGTAILRFLLALFLVQAGFIRAQPGNAITFDGTDDYVTVANNASLQLTGTTITLEAWVNASAWETNSYDGYIVAMEDSDNEGYMIRVGDNGKVNFTIGNGSSWSELITSAVLTLNRWHHIAGVYDGTTQMIYVDGKLITSTSASLTLSAAENDLLIGSSFDYTATRLFQGSIDEVRIWDVARTQDELLDYSYQLLDGTESGLVAYYRMSDGAGTSLTDNGLNGLTGTLTNGPTWAASTARIASSAAVASQFRRPGTCLTFDGSNESVSVPNSASLNPTTALTVEAWVYVNSFTGSPRIVSKADASTATNGYGMSVAVTTGRFNPEVVVGGTRYAINTAASAVSLSAWTHVAFTWAQNGSLIAYINGRRVASTTTANNTLSNTSSALTIAQAAYGASSFLNGNVDEVRIWNTTRTDQQIQENMFRTLEGDESGLVAYYRFDDAAGSTLADKTSNANDGTIANIESSDWADATGWEAGKVWTADGNWSDLDTWLTYSIPNATTTPVFLFNDVEMDNSVNASQLVIASGVTANFQSGFTLTLARDFVNHGTTTGTGGLALNGSASIQVNGTGTTSIGTFDSNNASGVVLGMSMTVEDELRLSRGALTIGANTITVNEQITRTSGSFTGGATSNIVIGSALGASTILPTVTLQNLTVDRENGVVLTGNVTVNSTLTMNDAKIFVSDFVLTLGNTATIAGSPFSSSNMIVVETTSGSLRKNFPSASSFLYPVGDQTGYYTPITLTFNSGSFSSGYAAVSLQVLKHPDNTSVTHFINRYWTIQSGGISSFNCSLSAIYDDVDIEGDEAEYHGGKWDGSAWSVLDPVTAASNQITGTVTSFSDYTAGEYAVFPLEWLNFTAEPKDNEVLLNWTTAREQNTAYFEIERSTDRDIWEKIGEEKAAGNSTTNRNYTHTDNNPLSTTAYYRLQQIDIDGKNSYSNVVEVHPMDVTLQIYPNPVSDILNVNLGEGHAEVINDLGQTVAQYMLTSDRNTLPISQLTPGTYVLRVQTKTNLVHNFKFVKQ